jgi:hypothetical protein
MKPILNFYRQLKQALFVRDVYAPMFFCDFINMIIVIAFYSQFGVCIFEIIDFLLYIYIYKFLLFTVN